jgi:lysophospholipase L1-like esterase
LLTSQIAEAAGGKPEVKVKNIADFERSLTDYKLADELKEELAFEADVIIVALGENASSPKTEEAKAQFETAFTNLFAELKKPGEPTIFVRSQFWQDAEKDQLLKKTCEAAGGTFIDISKLGFDESNYARAERKIEHAGVAGHPGDKGMKALADVLWDAIKRHAVAE